MAITPIFIFSITRSGSTLLQRVIAAHDGVATVSEPWLLLPYLYTLRERGVVAEYTHPLMSRAVHDFCEALPAGVEDYEEELRGFVLRLYEKAASAQSATARSGQEVRYFLDKSPPYYFVAEEIMRLFPQGKFVFLWRNPLSVVGSIVDTWLGGAWRATAFREDLFIGLPRLIAAYRANRQRAHCVNFENLVGEDQRHWRALVEYLGLEFDPSALDRFAEVHLNGRMGDQTGVKRYQRLDSEPTEKWKATLANPLRRAWCRRYLGFLGSERLATMGYDSQELLCELASQPHSRDSLVPDLRRLLVDVAKEPVRARVRRNGIGGPNVLRELLRSRP